VSIELPSARPPSTAVGPAAYFSCRNLHAYYGQSYVVQGVGFEVHKGEIWLDGKALHAMTSWQAARNGVSLVPEDRRIIGGLTVEENLQLARIEEPRGWSIDRLYMHFPRLAERRRQDAVTLSGGEQQMLAVARALARDVKLLLLDEPYEGLAPVIVREIEKILEEIKALGLTTIIVEQNAVAALHLADRALILDMGEIVFDGTAREVIDNEQLRHQYLAI
jgi:branched-chain amino acid transport system ATP-binding protein